MTEDLTAAELESLQALADREQRKAWKFEDDLEDVRSRAAMLSIVRQEEAAAQLKLPAPEDASLAALLVEKFTDEPFTVDGLLKRGTNGLFTASYKTGKTSTALDLARCLVDGEPFLGAYDTTLEGNVGFFNCEMTKRDWRDYAALLQVGQTNRVRAWHLRGYALPLLSDAGSAAAVEWLRRNEVGFWVLDPWSSITKWAGVSENSNDEVGQLLLRLDQIKLEAGVSELFICAHTGRKEHERGAEHARGATAVDDWPDSRWILTKAGDERYLYVEGRGVQMPELTLDRDERCRLRIGGGSRAATRRQARVDEVVKIVNAQPGRNVGETIADMQTTSNDGEKRAAWKQGVADGRLEVRPEGNNKYLFPAESVNQGGA